ncbi:MAG: prepilin-type N-terminal cleavage/methylation domain-containing protein, partial [Candidatus Gastranaerophilales bacterium]|nr:prepilin-type N-terminal cleavage/methylation domain-containing protein [Candidatus Gastranaerophilales bacterium]
MYKIKKFGFTLAEVLITLVIIGVIAAITVPSILQTTQK